MAVGAAIYAQLSEHTALTALVGENITPEFVRQEDRAYPCVVYVATGKKPVRTYAGDTSLTDSEVHVFCQARSYSQSQQVADAVSDAIDNGSGTWGGITVRGVFLEDQNEVVISNSQTDESDLVYQTEQIFKVWWINTA